MEKQYFSNVERLNDVVVIRSLAIVMVVAFHAYHMMFVPAHFPASQAVYHDMYYTLNCLILQFRMPLFIMISGYLFSHLENDRGKYATFKGLLKNKFKRLIIPFYVFATVFMLSIHDFKWEPYYSWSYQHLWFITMLFWCFMLTRALSFLPFGRKRWFRASALALFFALTFISMEDFRILSLMNLLRRYFWFYAGYQLYLNRDKVYGFVDRHKAAALSVLLAATVVCIGYKSLVFSDNSTHTWYSELGNITICLLIWYAVNCLIINKVITGGVLRPFNWLNKYSYGIYVFHNWLQPFMISSTAIALFNLDELAMEHTVLFPFLFFASSFFISLGLSWLLLKTRAGRFLIG